MRMMSRFGEVVAEDLGAVPPFLRPSLERLGVPGYRVLRWEKDGDGYRDPAVWPAIVGGDQRHARHRHAPPTGTTRCRPRSASSCGAIPALGGLDPAQPFDDRARDLLLARSTRRRRRWR